MFCNLKLRKCDYELKSKKRNKIRKNMDWNIRMEKVMHLKLGESEKMQK